MFWLFIGVFAVYFLVIAAAVAAGALVAAAQSALGMPSAQVRGIFVGYVCAGKLPASACCLIAQGLSGRYDYQLSVFESDREDAQGRRVYCVVHVPNDWRRASDWRCPAGCGADAAGGWPAGMGSISACCCPVLTMADCRRLSTLRVRSADAATGATVASCAAR
jgi:hypothetical protein